MAEERVLAANSLYSQAIDLLGLSFRCSSNPARGSAGVLENHALIRNYGRATLKPSNHSLGL